MSLHEISSIPPNLVYLSFLKRIILKIGNTKSGSLKNETENNYYKVITKCDRGLLQRASGITKHDRVLLQSASGITKCDRLLLQSASGITKCDSYKVRRNKNQILAWF